MVATWVKTHYTLFLHLDEIEKKKKQFWHVLENSDF